MPHDDRICIACVGDPITKQFILNNGDLQDCSRHGDVGKNTISIAEMGNAFAEAFHTYYSPSSTYRREFDGPDDDNGHDVLKGQNSNEILEENLGSEYPKIAEGIINYLIDGEPRGKPGDPEERGWDFDALYEYQGISTHQHDHSWQWFKDHIAHERRFFGKEALGVLDELFGHESSINWIGVDSPIQTIQSEERVIYRGRIARNKEEVEKFLADPISQLSPPPPPLATAGRLNPHGIRRFYGAFDVETCIRELRPAIGDLVIITEFNIKKPIQVYDFTVFKDGFLTPNLFDENTSWEDLSKRRFLYDLHKDITQPVTGHSEPLSYLPTQMIAEFSEHEMLVEGVITYSSQVDDEDAENITLFKGNGLIEGDQVYELKSEQNFEDFTQFDTFFSFGKESKIENEIEVVDNSVLKLNATSTKIIEITGNKYEWNETYL